MWKWFIVFVLLTIFLIPTPVLADTSGDVTVTATGYICGAPGNFTLTYVSDYEIGISWTKGADAVNTMVRGAVGRVPESRTDGYLVYYGTGTSTSDTGVSLDETAAPIYYRAWSQNAASVWEEVGVSDFLEGFGMLTVAIALIVLVFTVLAFLRRDAMLYMLGTIGWLFMTFYLVNLNYPAENAYLPYAIAGFCLSVTLIMAIQAVNVYFSGRPRPPTSGEIQAEHKRKVMGLTKRARERKWWEE